MTTPPLASIFSVIVRGTTGNSKRSIASIPILPRLPNPDADLEDLLNPAHSLSKRQTYILAIPTTYAGLNAGPAPGVVVGATLGAVLGTVLLLLLIMSLLRLYTGRAVIKETEIIERKHRARRSRSRSSRATSVPVPRRQSRRETTIIEERRTERSVSRPRDEEVIVEEEEDDIVEVIEEHSPERRPNRKKDRLSGFRTVDPAELGGGSAPMRKLGRRG